MKKNNIIKILLQSLSLLIAIGLAIGLWAFASFSGIADLFPGENTENFIAVSLVCLLVALIVINVLKSRNFNKRFNKMNAHEKQDYALEQKEKIQKDVKTAEKNLKQKMGFFTFYKILVLALVCLFVTFLSMVNEFSMPWILMCVFLIWSILNSFIPLPQQKIDSQTILSKSEFPQIYSVINKAAKRINYKGKIYATIAGKGVSIHERGNKVYLLMGAEELSLFNEDELFAVLVHEFAHLKNADTIRRSRLHSFIDKNESHGPANTILDVGATLFYGGFLKEVIFEIIKFDSLSSLEHEKTADLAVLEAGVSQDFINATAKVMLFAIYGEYPWKEISFDTYESLSPITNFCQVNLNCFFNKLAIYGDRWHFTLKNELPSRIDSHPTLKMRMDALKVSEYQTDFTKKEGTYTQEIDRLLEKSSVLIANHGFKNDKKNDEYLKIRAVAYEERVAVMNAYDNQDHEWESLSDSALIECAQAFLYIDDSKSEKILRSIIEKNNSSFACYLLACLYAREYNDDCIELFKRSAVDSAATDEAMDQLGKYALKTGNQELLNEYRKVAPDKLEFAEEEIMQTLFTKEGLIAPNNTHAEDVKEIVEKLNEYWGNILTAVHIGVRETESQTTVYYIAIDYNKKAPREESQKAYEETCYFINRLSVVGKRFYIFFGGKEFNTLKKLNGSKVYEKKSDK